MVSLCCCGGGGDPQVKFGFARHRRWGFIPYTALRGDPGQIQGFPLADVPGAPALESWSKWQVYTQLRCFESVTYSADPALNEVGEVIGTINRLSGTLTQARTGVPNGPLLDSGIHQLPTIQPLPRQATYPNVTTDYELTATKLRWVYAYDYTNQPNPGAPGGPAAGRVTRVQERELSVPVTEQLVVGDVEALLAAIDLSDIPTPTLGNGNPGGWLGRVAYYDANGEIQLLASPFVDNTIPVERMRPTEFVPITRDQSGILFPSAFDPSTGGTGVVGARVALWAGWTTNPGDVEPESSLAASGVSSRTTERPDGTDRFTVFGAKCHIRSRPATLYRRETGSPWYGRLVGEECADLVAEAGNAREFLLGALPVDEAAHPGVQSVRPWASWSAGGFYQVNQVACG